MTGILPENELRPDLPESVFLEPFWQAVRAGKPVSVSHREAERLSRKHFFGFEPITELPADDLAYLRQYLAGVVFGGLNNYRYSLLSKNPVVFIGTEHDIPYIWKERADSTRHRRTFLTETVAGQFVAAGWPALTAEEKISLFRNPQVWESGRLVCDIIGNSDVRGQGSRPFFRREGISTYGIDRNIFRARVGEIRRRTGHAALRICDIGGLMGAACADIRRSYPSFHFTNISIDEEPAMYPDIRHRFAPAERLPADMIESADYAVSSFNGFRYILFPEFALANIAHILTVGGEADISLYSDHFVFSEEVRTERLSHAHNVLNHLQRQGYLSYDFNPNPDIPFSGHLKIIKLASIPRQTASRH